MMSQFLGQASEEQYLSTIPLKRFAEPSGTSDSSISLMLSARE